MNDKEAHVKIDIEEITGKKTIHFETIELRKAMRTIGKEVQSEARKLVGIRKVSTEGAYPGKGTGRLFRSIVPRVSKSGFSVVIRPKRNASFEQKEFYPSFLHYGVQAKRSKSHKKHKNNDVMRIRPRKNYMVDALEAKQNRIRSVIFNALEDGVKVK